nr:phosphotransferase [Arthrobacter caoxuetaonis]
MELAALASAAVPALVLTGVAGSPDDAADFDAALLVDDAGKQWRVRSPKHVEASMRLETELLVLRAFVPAVRAELPFALPYVAGTVRKGELCTFVYSHLPGATRDIDELAAAGKDLAEDIGRTLAAIHALPQSLVNNADLPSYTANEFRQRKLNELDQAATTGKIPATLLRRWEHALEDIGLWRFSPNVVHGDLHEDNLLVSGGRISAVIGWTDLRIGDPADDFAWLIAANNSAFTDAVHAAYVAARPDAVDPHLIRRAALSAEFALAQWLVRGLAAGNQAMVKEAEEMLATLEADILEQESALATEADAAAAVPVSAPVPVPAPAPADQDSVPAKAPAGSKVTVKPLPNPEAEKVSVTPLPEPANAAAAEDSAGNDKPDAPSTAPADAAAASGVAVPGDAPPAAASNPQPQASNPQAEAGAGKSDPQADAVEPATSAIPLVAVETPPAEADRSARP